MRGARRGSQLRRRRSLERTERGASKPVKKVEIRPNDAYSEASALRLIPSAIPERGWKDNRNVLASIFHQKIH